MEDKKSRKFYEIVPTYKPGTTFCEIKEVLPEGIDRTEEAYKREILKLRIENERLKKNYTVQTNEAGEQEYVRLKVKNSK